MMQITHGRITLALHELARTDGPSLLLLHALHGSSDDWGEIFAAWPGSVYALDFAGHGRSQWLSGGAYYPELLLGDADAALAHIGPAAIVGAGLGAYVALLVAGARPDSVPAALLLPGDGLHGGGPLPDFTRDVSFVAQADPLTAYDPLVSGLEKFARPPDYAETFARAAQRLLLFEDGEARPPWWEITRTSPSAETVAGDLSSSLTRLAAAITGPRRALA